MLKSVDINRCKLVREQEVEYDSVETCTDVVNLMHLLGYADACEEYFVLFCLNVRNEVIGIHELSHGNIASTIVSIRSVFQRAILNNAAAIICSHVHPSGRTDPSQEDLDTTSRLVEAGHLMEIPLLDHIIVSDSDYTSLRNEGLM